MSLFEELFQPVSAGQNQLAEQLVLALLVAFVVGQLNAWCYKWTHRGLSYSRTFTQALVLISVVASLSMSLVASRSLVAVGLLGGFAIIRFRTVVRDARDTAYVFLCLICGMAAGFGFYGTALAGAGIANLVGIYLHLSEFGAWHASDNLLRFQIEAAALTSAGFEALLRRFCRRVSVVSVDESAVPGEDGRPVCQCAYRLRLRDPHLGPDLVAALKQTFHVEAVHLLVEQQYEEVA